MEEILIRAIENGIALTILGVAWRMAENRYDKERLRNEQLQDRYLDHFEKEHPQQKTGQ